MPELLPTLTDLAPRSGRTPAALTVQAAWLVVCKVAGDWRPVADVCDGYRAWPLYEDGGEAESVAAAFRKADPGGDYEAVAVSARLTPRFA